LFFCVKKNIEYCHQATWINSKIIHAAVGNMLMYVMQIAKPADLQPTMDDVLVNVPLNVDIEASL
jgi:hypothetical protein